MHYIITSHHEITHSKVSGESRGRFLSILCIVSGPIICILLTVFLTLQSDFLTLQGDFLSIVGLCKAISYRSLCFGQVFIFERSYFCCAFLHFYIIFLHFYCIFVPVYGIFLPFYVIFLTLQGNFLQTLATTFLMEALCV